VSFLYASPEAVLLASSGGASRSSGVIICGINRLAGLALALTAFSSSRSPLHADVVHSKERPTVRQECAHIRVPRDRIVSAPGASAAILVELTANRRLAHSQHSFATNYRRRLEREIDEMREFDRSRALTGCKTIGVCLMLICEWHRHKEQHLSLRATQARSASRKCCFVVSVTERR
jgi:hypothetical protein